MRDTILPVAESALKGATFQGFADLRELGPMGMITLRVKPGTRGLKTALTKAVGAGLPEARQILTGKLGRVAWMSPDEFLLIVPQEGVADALQALENSLSGQHYLAVDVSDARAVFRITGQAADQVLSKLTPADLNKLAPDEVRRSRVAQVSAAFWPEPEGGYTLICFRSVARYVMDLLSNAARPGSGL